MNKYKYIYKHIYKNKYRYKYIYKHIYTNNICLKTLKRRKKPPAHHHQPQKIIKFYKIRKKAEELIIKANQAFFKLYKKTFLFFLF